MSRAVLLANLRLALRTAIVLAAAAVWSGARSETLAEAWAAALAGDGRLAAATARAAATEAALAGARAERLPSVTATSATTRWRDTPAFDFGGMGVPNVQPLFGGDALNVASAQVSMPLYTGGALAANVTAATAERDGQTRSTDTVRQDLKLAVAAAYIGVLRAASALDVARSNAASLAAHARDVEDMRRAGQVPTNDYLAAAVSLAAARQGELQAENALDVARAIYNRRVARPFDAPVSVEPLSAPLGGEAIAAPVAELVSTAQAARPELAQLDAAAGALAARAAAARAARRPQLAVSGGYAHLENEFLNREDFWFVSLGVRVDLFDSGRSRHASATLERQSAAVADDQRDRAAEIELEVRRAAADLSTARARGDVAAGAVQQAEENLRVVRDRYRNGEGTNTEVLDAEALRAQSASNFDTAGYDLRLAELTLARAVGAL
jgi:outer membrane protein TolC